MLCAGREGTCDRIMANIPSMVDRPVTYGALIRAFLPGLARLIAGKRAPPIAGLAVAVPPR